MRTTDPGRTTLHATTVGWQNQGALILGKSGSGKSSFALRLMAYGCDLVADDRTILSLDQGNLIAACPPQIAGRIEARGVGILAAKYTPNVQVCCAICLDERETARLPEEKSITFLGVSVRLFLKPEFDAFPEAVLHYIKSHQP